MPQQIRSRLTLPKPDSDYNRQLEQALVSYSAELASVVNSTPKSSCLFTQTADKTVANTTTETDLFGTGSGSLVLPAKFLIVGRTLRVRIRGVISDTLNPTVRVKLKLGATIIVDTGAVATAATLSNSYFEFEAGITCRAVGASGTVMGSGGFLYDAGSLGSNIISAVVTAAVTVDTTASLTLGTTFQWGAADAANTITSQIATLEALYSSLTS